MIVFYFLFLAVFALLVSSPMAVLSLVVGWLASRRANLPTRRHLAKVVSASVLWAVATGWCFFVDGTGEVVFVLVMAAFWTLPVIWVASSLADRPDNIDRRMRQLEREARG